MVRVILWGFLALFCCHRFLIHAGLISPRPVPRTTDEPVAITVVKEEKKPVKPEPIEDVIASLILDKVNPSLPSHEAASIAANIVKWSRQYDLDPLLVLGVVHAESSARFWVDNRKGCLGLMQVKRSVWGPSLKYNAIINDDGDYFRIPTAIRAGCFILSHYLKENDGDIDEALSRYSGGAGARYMAKAKAFIEQ